MRSRDSFQLIFVASLVLVAAFVFFWTSALRPTALFTILNLVLLRPVIRWLESKSLSKTQAIIVVFFLSAFVVFFGIMNAVQLIREQGSTLLESLPSLWPQVLEKITHLQASFENKLGIKLGSGAANWLMQFGSDTQDWLLTHLPQVLADAASAAFLVPVFSFFLLKDGTNIKNQFYRFLPERFRSSTSEVIQETSHALAAYLRAKIIEASSVGILAWIGFWIVGAPYAGVLALIVGLTNIIPYLGIALGALPPLLIFSLTESFQPYFWPALIVLIIVNAIDTLLIFPIFVAKIVNLSPLTLLAAVAVGQEYYGLIGMLIAVPLASVLKIIYLEIVEVLYERPTLQS